MCALVLAVRKVPIYGPGGGAAALGSMDAPSYSVSVSPEEAAKYRSDFADGKEAKRLIPTKKPELDSQSMAGTDYSGVTAHQEIRAMQALNSRNPVVDRARDDAFAARENGNDSTATADERRSLEEVRGMLTRENTRGRRHLGQLSPVIEPPRMQTYPMVPPASGLQYVPPPASAPQILPIPGNAFNNVQRREMGSPIQTTQSQGVSPTSATSPPSRGR